MVSTVQGEWARRLFIRANAAAADSSIAVTNRLNPTNPARARISLAMTLPCSPLSRLRVLSLPLSLLSSAIRCSVTSSTNDNRNNAPTVIWDNSGDDEGPLQNEAQSSRLCASTAGPWSKRTAKVTNQKERVVIPSHWSNQ